jgi:hypothetical protein
MVLNRILYETWKIAEQIINSNLSANPNDLSDLEKFRRIIEIIRNTKRSEEFRAKSNSIYRNNNAIMWMLGYLLTPPHDKNDSLSKQEAFALGFDQSPSSWSQRSQFISHFGFVNDWSDTNLTLNSHGKNLKEAVRGRYTPKQLMEWSGSCPKEVVDLYKYSLVNTTIDQITPTMKTCLCAILMLMDGELYKQDSENRVPTDVEKDIAAKYFDLNPLSQDLKWIGHWGRIFQGLGLAEEDTTDIDSRKIFRGTPSTENLINEIVKEWSTREPTVVTPRIGFAEGIRLGRIEFVTFHQSYSYEEFVEGIRPILSSNENIGYVLEDGVFKTIASRAENQLTENFVLIIDEINRGNISRIFGDLITVIDPDKRKSHSNVEQPQEIRLTYSKTLFGVPSNLYIVGTMNSADRSIANLDIALRRRFSFIECYPKPETLKNNFIYNDREIDLGKFLSSINLQILRLKSKEYLIGHSYLMRISTWEELMLVLRNQILPLLDEYFHGDNSKIAQVFGNLPSDSRVDSEKIIWNTTENSTSNLDYYDDLGIDSINYFINPYILSGNFHQIPAEAIIKVYS